MPLYYVTLKSQTDEHRRFVTLEAEGEEEARARVEELEAQYTAFRLDEDATLDYYGLPSDLLAEVEDSCEIHREDTDTETAGSSGRARSPAQTPATAPTYSSMSRRSRTRSHRSGTPTSSPSSPPDSTAFRRRNRSDGTATDP
jgi:hypothetical protein